ncbi:MAG: ATP-binding protein [Candidatus Rokuibacteriota bacterium]
MRLALKIFLTSAVLVVVLAVVGLLSLYAVGRLASVNREITTQAVPIVRLVSSLRDAMRALSRLEARYVILRDPLYATLWDETAARVEVDLVQVQAAVTTPGQRATTAEAIFAFDSYRELVADERALLAKGNRQQALRLADTEGPARADRVDVMLERLTRETDAAVKNALAEATRLERRTWTWVMASLGMAVVLALVGSGLVAFRLTRSLRRLSVATRALAEGSFRTPIKISDRDEVGELARSFNAMAQQLRQIDAMKEEFFATISHDLKSPLGSIAEAAYLLRDGVAGSLSPRQARLMSIISASTDRILSLVNRLLHLSRLRAGMLPLECRPVNVASVAERAVEELRPQAETAEVTLEHERVGADFVVEGDEERLGEVVINLGVNAIQFTPKGGLVRVRVTDAGSEVTLEVEDTGIGIPAAALPGIFERYQQARRDRAGSGLGLAIVRGVVEAHGGRVAVESADGKGTRFTVTLPRVADTR